MRSKVISSSKMRQSTLESFDSLLKEVAEVRFLHPWTTDEFLEEVKDAQALIAFHESVDQELLDQAPKLKIVSRFGVGYDKVDVEACTARGVYVTYTPGVLSRAVAELTIALMLSLSRRIPVADRYVRTEWGKPGTPLLPLRHDVAGKTLGIIGLGRIGYEVARRAKAFDMKIVYYDPVRNKNAEEDPKIQHRALDDLLKTSDFVTVHVPLTPETTHLIGKKELRLMKKTAYLINTSRGPVVDEKALGRALKESWIAGAGLDVFTQEPLPLDSPLIELENVVLTPHMGTHTVETRRLMISAIVEDIKRALAGEVPLNLVPEQRGKVFETKPKPP